MFLRSLLDEQDDITREEMRARRLAEHSLTVGMGTLWRYLDVQPHKKTAHAAEQARPNVSEARQACFEAQPDLDPARFVFLEET